MMVGPEPTLNEVNECYSILNILAATYYDIFKESKYWKH
jgi:hypothetical protein